MKVRKTIKSAALLLGSMVMLSAPAYSEELTIGLSVPSLASAFWTSATYGVEQEAKEENATLLKLDAGGDTNVTQQVSQISDLIQRRVDAIIIGATNGDALKAITERAIAAGIPVIGFSSPPSTESLSSYIGADHYDMGRLQARCLADGMGGKGKVAMLSFIEGQIWAEYRANGFKETLAKEFPEIEVVVENRLAVTRAQAITTVEDILQRNAEITGIYTTVDELAAGAVTALKSAGKNDAVTVSTSNLSPVARQMLMDGDIACTSVQLIVEQGRNALKQAVLAATESKNDGAVILPAVLVTKENLPGLDLAPIVAPESYRP
ncbi:substrate-binding domain-containing protein [uncultured Sulfitobacter sp.]|uniref:sugar ABC transporter substrate-binding protein n=1 Tax=uncultured Sulfitobacter sp. TaxID=191468 RepID=UPI0025922544|nr:substrate-binding domain-containing protein [uncultured Sulfitobacter sp.]